MSDIFAEVDQALKQERLEKLWKDYGGLVIGFLAVVVLGTAANAGYTSWKTAKNTKSTDTFLNLTQKTNSTPEDMVNAAPHLENGVGALALLTAAGKEQKSGNAAKATDIYKQIAGDKNYDPALTALAQYMSISIDPEMDASTKLKYFTTILTDENNPYRYRAYLDAALLEAELNGDYKKARAYLDIIAKSEYVPQTYKQKAQSIDIVYALKETAEQTENK